ncbi:App1 family protein [Amnibacterium endophyticum]|uniref:App1 family protein n=1 Tax=Amnibacterium endophyticum TaxID=2109337 RepID=A0ABW4LHE0_9MICO
MPTTPEAASHRRRFRRRTPSPAVEQAVGRAMRVDQAIREFREQRARRKGRTPIVIPYAGYGSTSWIRVLGRVLITNRDPSAEGLESIRGWRSFTGIPVDRAPVLVEAGGTRHHVLADRGGVIDVKIEVALTPGWHDVTLRCEDVPDADEFTAPVFVLDPDAPFGVVSDIDDTVMVTALPRPLLAAWNTFVLNEHARNPTPGMSVLYDRIRRAHPAAPFLYLSTGAWNVAPTLRRFLSRNLYPAGPLLLTDWGPEPDRIFRSGRAHKIDELERLAAEFPDVKWLLIGDDGQHDEETYSGFAEAHPENVAAIGIRQLSDSEAVLAGGRSRERWREDVTEVDWIFAPDGNDFARALEARGLL